MNIGISGFSTDHGDIGLLAEKTEALGFESIWLPEHPVIPIVHDTKYAGTPDGSIPDSMSHQVNPFIALARAGTGKGYRWSSVGFSIKKHPSISRLSGPVGNSLHFSVLGKFFNWFL